MIKRKSYFKATISNSYEKLYIIVPNSYEDFPFNCKEGGSYNVAPARVLGLKYSDYLRFVRDLFPEDVIIRGKEILPIPYWRGGDVLNKFIELLNLKMSMAVGTAKEQQNDVS